MDRLTDKPITLPPVAHVHGVIIGLQHRQAESRSGSASSMHRNSPRSCKMVVPLGIREYASNDRHVFLKVVEFAPKLSRVGFAW